MPLKRLAAPLLMLCMSAVVLRAGAATGPDLRIAAASDLQVALPALVETFERESGRSVTVSFGFPKMGHFLPPGAARRGLSQSSPYTTGAVEADAVGTGMVAALPAPGTRAERSAARRGGR